MAQQGTPAAPAPPPARSGLFQAGKILLLVGAILHTVGAVMLIIFGTLLLTIGDLLRSSGFPALLVGTLYLGLGIVLGIGAVLAWASYREAKAGSAQKAWVLGLAASLLPPIQVVTLVGAILCKVSPEGEAQERAKAP